MQPKQIIDLTHPVEEGMLTFDSTWHPKVAITQLGRIGLEGRESRKLELGTHTGTHIDAPLHFFGGGRPINEVPLELLVGDVSIQDFSHLKSNDSIDLEMVKKINITSRIIFKFGWSKHWGTSQYYKGWPFFNQDAAQYLVEQGVKLIGIDTPSPDDSRISLSGNTIGSKEDSPVHKIFLGQGVILMEYMANLDKIKDLQGWTLAAMPLFVKGADGAPARVCVFK